MSEKNINQQPNCDICNTPCTILIDHQLKISKQSVTYAVCPNCGFTKKTTAFFANAIEEKRQYDFHENSLDNLGYVNYLKAFINEAVTPFIQKGSALDFGAGPGPVLSYLLKDLGFEVSLYDPFYHPDKTVLNNHYDLITSTEVFEHFYNPLESIKEVVDCLKPNGLLVVMTSFKTMDDETFKTWWYRRDITHVSFYTEEAFEIIASKFNLRKIYTNHVNIIVFRKED
ncbi:class I SAM-dependent methyltransferase [Liberiplasma polymorphum]|uniref:class I SAM-dependent methyltransferase n=1 Tax=Liberiplasma polymorphum TaxID=3374570 RepID=UPI003775BF33